MRNNFYNQGTNIIAHHYFNLEKKTNPIRYNTIGSSPQIVTHDLPRFTKRYSEEGQSGYTGEMAGTGNTRGQQEGTRSATDNQKYVIRSLGELTGPLRAGQSGQTLDLRDHNISPEVYMALARGEAVEVELQQMAPERVNLFTPMLASVMQIFGGMSGGVAYNEDLSQVITGRGGSDKGQLGKAAEFVNRHGSAYSFGLGTGEHIDVVAKFRVLNQEDSRKPAKDIVEPPPYKAPSNPPKEEPKEEPVKEDASIPDLTRGSNFIDGKTVPTDVNITQKKNDPQTITTVTPKPPTPSPVAKPAPIINEPNDKVSTAIPDVIDPEFFKLMNTRLGYFKDGLNIVQAAQKSGLNIEQFRDVLNKAGITIDPKTDKPTEITVANFLNNRYNTRQGSDIVTNDGRGKNPGAGYTDKSGNTQSSAIIPSLDLKGLAEGGYKFDLDLKGKAVSDYVLTAMHATPAFDNGVGSFDTPLHEGITEKDVKDAQSTLSKYPGKTPEQLLTIAKGMEKSNPQEAAKIYASLFVQVENNTRVENGHLGAGHVNKLRESVVTRTNVFVDGSRALNTLVNANGANFPVNVANLSTALSGNQAEINEQSNGLRNAISLYNKTHSDKIDPANISKQDALNLLDFSQDKLKEIKTSLEKQGYIDADPEFRIIHSQIDSVIGKPDNNLRDGNNSGINALKTLINNGTNQVGTSSREYKEYNAIAEKQAKNTGTPLSQADLNKLENLSKSSDPKVANAAKTMISNNAQLVKDIESSKQSEVDTSTQQTVIDASKSASLLNDIAQGKIQLPISEENMTLLGKSGLKKEDIDKINTGSLEAITSALNKVKSSLSSATNNPDAVKLKSEIDNVINYVNNKSSSVSSNLNNISEQVSGIPGNGVLTENAKNKLNSALNNVESDLINQIPSSLRDKIAPGGKIDFNSIDKYKSELSPSLVSNLEKFSGIKNDVTSVMSRTASNDVKNEYNLSIGAREYLDPFIQSLEDKGIDTSFLMSKDSKTGKESIDYKKVENFANALQGLDENTPPQGQFKNQLAQVIAVDKDKSLVNTARNINQKFSEFQLGRTQDQEAKDVLQQFLSNPSYKLTPRDSEMLKKNLNSYMSPEIVTESASYIKINTDTMSVPAVKHMVNESFNIAVKAGIITQAEVNAATTDKDKVALFDKMENILNERYNPGLRGETLTTDNLYGAAHITNLQRAINDAAQATVNGAQAVDKLYDGETMTEQDNKDLQVLVDKYNADPMNKDSQININDLKDNKALGSKLLDFAQKDLQKISDSIGPELSQYGQLAELKSDIIKSIGKPGSGSGIAAVKALLDKQANAPTPKPDKPSDTPNIPTSGNAKEYQEGLKNTLTQLKDCLASGVHEVNVDMDGDGKKEPVKISEYLKKLEKDYQMFLLQSSSGEKVDVQGMANLFSEVHYDAGMSLGNKGYSEVHQGFALALEAMGNVDVDNLFGSRGGKQTVNDSTGLTHAMINQVMLNQMRAKFNDCFDEKTGETDKAKLNEILKLGFKNVNDSQALQVLAITERLFKSAKYDDKNGSDLTQRYQDLVASGKKPDQALNEIFSDVQVNFAEANGFSSNEEARGMGILSTSEDKIIISGDQSSSVTSVSDLAGKHLNIETGTSSGSVQPPSSNVSSSTEEEETEEETEGTGTIGNVGQVGDNVAGNDNPVKPTEVAQANPPSNPQGNDLLARLDYTPGQPREQRVFTA